MESRLTRPFAYTFKTALGDSRRADRSLHTPVRLMYAMKSAWNLLHSYEAVDAVTGIGRRAVSVIKSRQTHLGLY